MGALDEATTRGFETLRPALEAGMDEIGQQEPITFFQYKKVVLPLDGYVFWVRTGGQTVVQGVLHYATEREQEESETVAVNDVLFTSTQQVVEFNQASPNFLYIARFQPPRSPNSPQPPPLRFAFSSRAPWQRMAGVYHYKGVALYPSLASQIVDVPSQLNTSELVVSNSLPAWLTLASYSPEWLIPQNPGLLLYPSFAVPDNLVPPYGSVHIYDTEVLQSAPWYDGTGGRYQLAADKVRVTLYGCGNDVASSFVDVVEQYSRDTSEIGMMSMMPAIQDGKKAQSEFAILAQQKVLEFQVSYVQSSLRNVARQLVDSALATVDAGLPGDLDDFVPASLGVNLVLTNLA